MICETIYEMILKCKNMKLLLMFIFATDRTTKDYGRHAKEIGRGSAVPGAWQSRSPGIYIAIISSILTATISSCLVGSKSSEQLYYSGGGKWVQSLKPL